MATKAPQLASMSCALYKSAFSGEVVFAIQTTSGQTYEGVAPKRYATSTHELSDKPVTGTVQVRVIRNGGNEAYIATPDGEALTVPAAAIAY